MVCYMARTSPPRRAFHHGFHGHLEFTVFVRFFISEATTQLRAFVHFEADPSLPFRVHLPLWSIYDDGP